MYGILSCYNTSFVFQPPRKSPWERRERNTNFAPFRCRRFSHNYFAPALTPLQNTIDFTVLWNFAIVGLLIDFDCMIGSGSTPGTTGQNKGILALTGSHWPFHCRTDDHSGSTGTSSHSAPIYIWNNCYCFLCIYLFIGVGAWTAIAILSSGNYRIEPLFYRSFQLLQ